MIAQRKADRRRELLRRRRVRSDADRSAGAAALAAGLPGVLDAVAGAVCLHVPAGSEPGRAPDGAVPLLDAARALGHRVLLPVTVGDAPLDWAEYRDPGDLVPGPFGLVEPAGERLGPHVVGEADVVVVPALAADRSGTRLGRGGGHYDRSLPLAAGARLIALVYDDELVDPLPVEPHDVRVHAVWRPRGGVLAVGPGTP